MQMLVRRAAFAAALAFVVSAPGLAAPPVKFTAQIHTVSLDNLCSDLHSTALTVAMGNSAASIVAMHNTSIYPGGPDFYAAGPLDVYYDSTDSCGIGATNRWVLNNVGGDLGSPLVIGQRFNIIVGQ